MDLFNDLAQEAHDRLTDKDGTFRPRDVAMYFVASVERELQAGRPEVDAFLDRLLIAGASKWLANWRRRSMTPAKTRNGADVALPAFAGIKVNGDNRQLRLLDFDLAAVDAQIRKLERHRNTYSRSIALLRDVRAVMSTDSRVRKVRDAIVKLGRAA